MDLKTLFIMQAAMSLMIVVVLWIYGKSQKVYGGYWLWTFGGLVMSVCYTVLLGRDLLPLWLSVTSNLGLSSLAAALRLDAAHTFLLGRRLPRRWYLPVALLLAFAYWFVFVDNHIGMRTFAMSVVIMGYTWGLGALVLRNAPQKGRMLYVAAGLAELVIGALLVVRGAFWVSDPLRTVFTNGPLQSVTFTVILVFDVIASVMYVMMHAQRTNSELETANAQIKTLRGILPFCMHCSRIRDKDGGWLKPEAYIIRHSEVGVSHGICPECLEIHYPDFRKPKDPA